LQLVLLFFAAANFISAQDPSIDHPQPGATSQDLAAKDLVTKMPYRSITAKQRIRWFVKGTVGPESLAAGVLSAAIGTSNNSPREYGPSWDGFGKRYGIRLTGISTGNAIEASLGAIWGEDPRYEREPEASFGTRVRNVLKLTFAAPRRDGHLTLAYARLIAIPANNILSNTWRTGSEAQPDDVALRTLWGILGRMGSNAFVEFWPDARRHIFHKTVD
jgi:hypothetical protein